MIELKNVTKIYKSKKGNDTIALNNVSINFPKKGLIFILGPSGSGKSTLLNMLGLLDTPTKGSVFINGQDTSKFKESKLSRYRNNYIGFVFQEFNLLEELNVYDNISFIMNRKDDYEVIDKYLNLVGLKNFGKRKISELSGGEKQRVAIARALLNNPSLILTDEPTGNLDSKNSDIIFDILKQISKEKLVIVVSHNEESANKYADSIIRIKDGQVVENNIINNEYSKVELRNTKNHISFKNKMKLAFGLLKTKKIRLLTTSILISIAFAIVGFTISTKNFDIARMHAEALTKENKNVVTIEKDNRGYAGTLSNKDLDEILPKLNWNYFKKSKILSADEYISEFSYSEDLHSMMEYSDNAYYKSIYAGEFNLITYDEKSLNNLSLIGKIPKNDREVLIPEILAELFTARGLMTFDDEYPNVNKSTTVKNKEELIGKKIAIPSDYLIITGIIKDENLKKFESLKEVSLKEMNYKPTKLYKEFINTYKEQYVVINDNFFEVSKFQENQSINNDLFPLVNKIDDKNYYLTVYNAINEEVTYFNGVEFVKTSKLNPGEVILSVATLEEYYPEINEKVVDEFKKQSNEYKKNLEICENNNTCDILKEPSFSEIKNKYYIEFIKENNLVGKNIVLELKDEHNYLSDTLYHQISLKVIGISLENIYSLVDKSVIQKYLLPNEIVESIELKDLNEQELENLFNDFLNLDKNYKIKSAYSKQIEGVSMVVASINKISNYLVIASLAFATLLLTIFISLNISINKKKIGILRALGASVNDVISIFILEALLIGLSAFVVSNILSVILINITNNFITKEIYFYLRPLIFNPYTIFIVLSLILVIIFISLVLPIVHLSKQKPVNLINK